MVQHAEYGVVHELNREPGSPVCRVVFESAGGLLGKAMFIWELGLVLHQGGDYGTVLGVSCPQALTSFGTGLRGEMLHSAPDFV